MAMAPLLIGFPCLAGVRQDRQGHRGHQVECDAAVGHHPVHFPPICIGLLIFGYYSIKGLYDVTGKFSGDHRLNKRSDSGIIRRSAGLHPESSETEKHRWFSYVRFARNNILYYIQGSEHGPFLLFKRMPDKVRNNGRFVGLAIRCWPVQLSIDFAGRQEPAHGKLSVLLFIYSWCGNCQHHPAVPECGKAWH